jgi:hypothetical protein
MNDETEYQSRLRLMYDWAYRSEEGRFLLQHIIGMCDVFDVGATKDAELVSAGRRSIMVQIFGELDGLKNGPLIKKRILSDLIDERSKSNVEIPEYDPLSGMGTGR